MVRLTAHEVACIDSISRRIINRELYQLDTTIPRSRQALGIIESNLSLKIHKRCRLHAIVSVDNIYYGSYIPVPFSDWCIFELEMYGSTILCMSVKEYDTKNYTYIVKDGNATTVRCIIHRLES